MWMDADGTLLTDKDGPDITHLSVTNYIITHMTVHFLVTL